MIWGYVDPSLPSYLILLLGGSGVLFAILIAVVSAIALALVVAGTVALVVLIKAKRKAARALHIDENANKEVEDELVVHTDESQN